jgi:hypothetical protein
MCHADTGEQSQFSVAVAMHVHCMQIDRRCRQRDCLVVGYNRCTALHKVQWTHQAGNSTRGREDIHVDWVDFAADAVQGEIIHS